MPCTVAPTVTANTIHALIRRHTSGGAVPWAAAMAVIDPAIRQLPEQEARRWARRDHGTDVLDFSQTYRCFAAPAVLEAVLRIQADREASRRDWTPVALTCHL